MIMNQPQSEKLVITHWYLLKTICQVSFKNNNLVPGIKDAL